MGVFRSDGDYIYLDCQYCEFYIPMYYFDSTQKLATDKGDIINVFGIINVGIFENNKLKELKTLKLPTLIDIYHYDSDVREVELISGEIVPCRVIKYLKGAKIMPARIIQTFNSCKAFLNYILTGNTPKLIPYSKILELWRKNQTIHGVHFGVSSLYLEMVVAGMSRNPKELSEKFCKVVGDSGVSEYDYHPSSVRQVCQYNSTFTAITFEDFDSMVTTSLNKARDKTKETISPVEQIIKF